MSLLTLLKPREGAVVVPPPGLGTFVHQAAPRLIVEVDFDNDPSTINRTWTDITEYVRHINYQTAGRQHELQRTEAGTLNALLDNRDGRFDPTFEGIGTGGYGAGAYGEAEYGSGGGGATIGYYPGVKRSRWIRVQGIWNDTIYARWQGLIENWDSEWPATGFDATTTITASDPFKILNLYDLNGTSFDAAPTGTRVREILELVGIPIGEIDAGVSDLPAVSFTGSTSALSHLQQVEETENGLLYADPVGRILFEDRNFRLLVQLLGDGPTIGDGGGNEIPYREPVRFEYDDSNVLNVAYVTPEGGTEASATNDASIATHFRRVLTRNILSDSQAEAQAAAEYLVARYGDPSPRVSTVEVIGQNNPDNWGIILGLRNSHRLIWKRRPSTEAVDRTISIPMFIERASEEITPGTLWRTTFQLSPADTERGWILGVSTLGVDTVLTY